MGRGAWPPLGRHRWSETSPPRHSTSRRQRRHHPWDRCIHSPGAGSALMTDISNPGRINLPLARTPPPGLCGMQHGAWSLPAPGHGHEVALALVSGADLSTCCTSFRVGRVNGGTRAKLGRKTIRNRPLRDLPDLPLLETASGREPGGNKEKTNEGKHKNLPDSRLHSRVLAVMSDK